MEYRFEIADSIKMPLFSVMVSIIDEWRTQLHRENVCDETTYFFEVPTKSFHRFPKGILKTVFAHLPLVKLSDWPNHGLVPKKNKVHVLIYNDH